MIKKVIRIENLGCLRKLEPGPGVGQAGKLVGIFAENGSGKTTLVAALRAAHEGTVEPLQERQSLPLAGSPIVELLTSAGTVKHSAEDRKDKQPTGCTRGNPRVQVACQPGGLNVKVRVEEGENAPWDGSWERGPARGAARPSTTSAACSRIPGVVES